MRQIIRLAALLSLLLLLCIISPSAPAQADSGKDGLLQYLAENHYIGRWVSYALDYGDGDIKTKMGEVDVSRYLAFTIFRDGTMVLEEFGNPRAYELQKTDGGFRFFILGRPHEIEMQDRQMVLKGQPYDTYLEQSKDPVGAWKAVSYESEEGAYPAEKLFPDGCTVMIGEQGYGIATINAERSFGLLMPYQYGEFNGKGVFFDPKFDAQADVFQMTYGKDAVVTFQRCMTEAGDIPVEAIPPYYRDPAEGGSAQPMQMKLLRIAHPPEGWVVDMNQLRDGADESRLVYSFRDEVNHLYASMSIRIYSDEALYYRDAIRRHQEIADDTKLSQITIGGVSFFYVDYVDGGTHYREYIGREPKANMNVYITISESPAGLFEYQPLLDSISFTLPVLSPAIVEPPLPEDSAPYVPQPGKVRIGGREITAAFLPMDAPLLITQASASNLTINGADMLALHGDTLYLLTGRRLYAMQIRDGRLFKSPVFPGGVWKMADEYASLSMAGDGALYVLDGVYTNFAIKDGEATQINEHLYNLSLHPSEEWGISFRGSHDTQVVDITKNGLTFEKWALHDLDDPQKRTGRFDSIEDVFISDGRVYVAGREDSGKGYSTVAAYDLGGSELFAFGAEDWKDPRWMNAATDVVQTKNSVVILDTYQGVLKVLSLSGELIGTIDCDQLLGAREAEILSITPAEDGFILSAVQTRDDRSCTEVLIFHITGI